MNYTENYHLPQWVETDRVQMEDFNAAMATIDATMRLSLTPEGVPAQYGTFSLTGSTAVGSTLASFSFSPRFMILEFYNETHIMANGISKYITFGSGNYSVAFQLTGSIVKLIKNDDRLGATYAANFVIWP